AGLVIEPLSVQCLTTRKPPLILSARKQGNDDLLTQTSNPAETVFVADWSLTMKGGLFAALDCVLRVQFMAGAIQGFRRSPEHPRSPAHPRHCPLAAQYSSRPPSHAR